MDHFTTVFTARRQLSDRKQTRPLISAPRPRPLPIRSAIRSIARRQSSTVTYRSIKSRRRGSVNTGRHWRRLATKVGFAEFRSGAWTNRINLLKNIATRSRVRGSELATGFSWSRERENSEEGMCDTREEGAGGRRRVDGNYARGESLSACC